MSEKRKFCVHFFFTIILWDLMGKKFFLTPKKVFLDTLARCHGTHRGMVAWRSILPAQGGRSTVHSMPRSGRGVVELIHAAKVQCGLGRAAGVAPWYVQCIARAARLRFPAARYAHDILATGRTRKNKYTTVRGVRRGEGDAFVDDVLKIL